MLNATDSTSSSKRSSIDDGRPVPQKQESRTIATSSGNRSNAEKPPEPSPADQQKVRSATTPTYLSVSFDQITRHAAKIKRAPASSQPAQVPKESPLSLDGLSKEVRALPQAKKLPNKPSVAELMFFVVGMRARDLQRAKITEERLLLMVSFLIQQGADLNAKDALGKLPLALAAKGGIPSVVKLLLDKGANIEGTLAKGSTPLIVAAGCGRVDVMNLLIARGAKLEAASELGTALSVAAGNGYVEAARILIDKGANLESRDEYGQTPLHLALHCGQVDTVDLLIKKGAKLDAADVNGRTPLHLAVIYGQPDMMGRLLELGADINALDASKCTPLLWAVEGGDTDIVELLLAKNAGLELATTTGETPLHAATKRGNLDMTRLLMEHRANVNAVDRCGLTTLHLAASNRQLEIVKALIKGRASINDRTNGRGTALTLAAGQGRVDIVKVLAERGATFVAPTKERSLLSPRKQKTDPIDEVLRQHDEQSRLTAHIPLGFDPYQLLRSTLQPIQFDDAKLPKNTPPLDHVCARVLSSESSSEELEHFLDLASNRGLPSAYREAVCKAFALARALGHYPKLKGLGAALGKRYRDSKSQLAKLSKNIDRQLKEGCSLLTLAAANGEMDMVRVLLKLKADPNLRDKTANTALLSAVKAGHFAVVAELIGAGADANLEDFSGYSTLYYVVKAFSDTDNPTGMSKLIKYLILKGYHFEHPNPDARGPKDLPTLADILVQPSDNLMQGLIPSFLEDTLSALNARLERAIARHDLAAVKTILKAGANPRTVNNLGNTAAQSAQLALGQLQNSSASNAANLADAKAILALLKSDE